MNYAVMSDEVEQIKQLIERRSCLKQKLIETHSKMK